MARMVDAAAVMIIHGAEGCARHIPMGIYQAYPDPGTGAAPWTIGWGSTGPDIHSGLQWTQQQCDARFRQDLDRVATSMVLALGGVTATDNQFSAMCSLAYNIGMGNFRSSSVLRFHKAGDQHEAAQAFGAWDKGGHRVLPGLVLRRAREAALYLTPDAGQ